MGLSASQARLLTLTARQHSVEYKAQKLEAEKLQLANDSDKVYNTYLENLDATKVQYKVVAKDGSISYQDASFSKLESAGFLFKVGNKICRDLSEVAKELDDQGIVKNLDTSKDSYTLLTTLVSEGFVQILQQKSDSEENYSYIPANSSDADKGKLVYTSATDGSKVYYTFTPTLTSGGCTLDEIKNGSGTAARDENGNSYLYYVFEDTSVSTSTKLQETSDTVGLKKAEAQYEADMAKINAKDSRYDTELSQLETERNAIKDEIETLKTVAKDNVERTFKLFS